MYELKTMGKRYFFRKMSIDHTASNILSAKMILASDGVVSD